VLIHNPKVQVAISKGMQAVKFFSY